MARAKTLKELEARLEGVDKIIANHTANRNKIQEKINAIKDAERRKRNAHLIKLGAYIESVACYIEDEEKFFAYVREYDYAIRRTQPEETQKRWSEEQEKKKKAEEEAAAKEKIAEAAVPNTPKKIYKSVKRRKPRIENEEVNFVPAEVGTADETPVEPEQIKKSIENEEVNFVPADAAADETPVEPKQIEKSIVDYLNMSDEDKENLAKKGILIR